MVLDGILSFFTLMLVKNFQTFFLVVYNTKGQYVEYSVIKLEHWRHSFVTRHHIETQPVSAPSPCEVLPGRENLRQ